MYLTFEVEPWWSERGISGSVRVYGPRLVLYENDNQGQTEVASVPLDDIFEQYSRWCEVLKEGD